MNTGATVLVVVLLVAGMVAMGTSTTAGELRALLRTPVALIVVVAVNLVLIPAAALLLIPALPLDDTPALALMVVAAAPGGGTGALLSLHLRGDVAHAVALQVVLAVTSLMAAPVWLQLYGTAGSSDASLRLGPLVAALVVFQLLPLAAGLGLRALRPESAGRLHPVARRIADVTLALLIVELVITSGSEIGQNHSGTVLGIGVVLALTALGGALSPGTPAVRRASGMTTLIRNLSLALAASAFADDADGAALVVLTYGLAMYLTAVGWIALSRGLAATGPRPRSAGTP